MVTGKIFTYTIVHIGFGHMALRAPYALAILELNDNSKITAILENTADLTKIKIGLPVHQTRIDDKLGKIFEIDNT